MSDRNDSSFAFALGILGGVVGGVVVGLLLAPKSGKETCEDLKKAADELGEKYSPEIGEAKKQAMQLIENSKCKMEKKYREFNDSLKAQKLAKAKNLEGEVQSF